MDRTADVLKLFWAEILEIELDPVDDLIVDDPGNVNAAWFGQRLNARRDVDAVTKHIATFRDNVAKIDPDAHRNAPLVG